MSIRLYRHIRSDYETLITFQGDQEDVDQLNQILPFRVQPSKRSGLYEKGYYFYLRGNQREKLEKITIDYLQDNYVAPEIRLLLFPANSTLPSDRPHDEWAQALEWQIRHFFTAKYYICDHGGLGHIVYRKHPSQLSETISAYEGITYRIAVSPDYTPSIQVDIHYTYQNGEKLINRSKALFELQDNPVGMAQLLSFETTDSQDILNIAQKFIQSLPPLTNGLVFRSEPVSAEELGWDAWFWEHDYPIQIEVGNKKITSLAQNISRQQMGFYHLPENVQIVFLSPDRNCFQSANNVDDETIYQEIKTKLKRMFGDGHPPIARIKYQTQDNFEPLIVAIEKHIQKKSSKSPLYLMVVPPKDSRQSEDSELVSLDKLTFNLSKKLRKLKEGGFTISLSWDNLDNEYDRQFVIENALIKGLTVLGAIPWRINNLPCPNYTDPVNICFFGVDVNINREIPVVGGVVLDGYGVLRAYHVVRISEPKGDVINEIEWGALLRGLFKHYQSIVNCTPLHVFLHRDGLFQAGELESLKEFFAERKYFYDLVEIRKSGAPRLWQPGNLFGTPSKDIAIGSEKLGQAYLGNTLSIQENLGDGKQVFPSPESLRIDRVAGGTSMKIIAGQVHALSRASIGAYRRTERLPASISYADSLVANIFVPKSNKMDFGRVLGPGAQPYWL